VLTTTLGTAVGANLINNVPMATVMAAAIRQGHVAPIALRHGLVYAVILGSDVGPNLTTIGSLSTVLWLVLLRRRHVEVTAWQYIRVGLLVTPPMLVLGALLIVVFS
jgi:arsenical pump membrane protein